MTVSNAAQAPAPPEEMPRHPLDPLTSEEISGVRTVLERAGLVGEGTLFPVVSLAEPAKTEVLRHRPGDRFDRRVLVVLLDGDTGDATETVVSLRDEAVERTRRLDPEVDGQPPITVEEFAVVDQVVKADDRWREALARRGVTDVEMVCVLPLSAGNFGIPGERGRRMLRALSFVRHRRDDLPWAHPVDGLTAYVDLTARKVTELVDRADLPIPAEEGNFGAGADVPYRTTLRPLEITQPEGPSFDIDGYQVRWENWSFRVGFDSREGLVLHQLTFRDAGRERPVVYRASVAEMVVPYADPSPVRFWQNYFDAGEYHLGKNANSLELGCDCLGEIRYLDAVVADDRGHPRTIANAICLHEEDFGVLWKHTDPFTELRESRRSRRLVVSSFVTVGNYDYGFYWYLYLDGTIQLECKATGVLFTGHHPGDGYPWGTEVAPALAAPYHQHLFSARLDMQVDGVHNAVDEVEVRRRPTGPDNPYGNAFTRTATRLRTEAEAARLADPAAGRCWVVVNPASRNRLGQPVGYALYPQGQPVLLADEGSSVARRATFATRHLWVTRYDEAERYPAGDYINQHPGGAGLPAWVGANRSLDGDDLVVWHTFGLTHFPRTEDWPVMPVEYCGFTLKPLGFFDRNPTLDLPPSAHHRHGDC